MMMKKVALLILCSILMIGTASAYIITISAPKTISAGEVLWVNGTSNLPPGFSTEISLSKPATTGIITEKTITIQADGSFSLSFDTSTLKAGTYRLEVVEKTDYPYGSSSVIWLFFEVVDRRSELTVTSPLTQNFDGILEVSGSISTIEDQGLKVLAKEGSRVFFGPEYIPTSDGIFDISIPIEQGGTYTVILTDNTNYSWTIRYNVLSPTPTTTRTTTISTTVTTPVPENHTATTTSSRTQPAYFEVKTNRGEVHAVTSSGVDWVVDYIDESGIKNKVNTRGTAAEEVRFEANGGTVYFKVYPDQYADQAPITLTVENAKSVSVCTTCQSLFGDANPTPTTPLPLFLTLCALVMLVIVIRRR